MGGVGGVQYAQVGVGVTGRSPLDESARQMLAGWKGALPRPRGQVDEIGYAGVRVGG